MTPTHCTIWVRFKKQEVFVKQAPHIGSELWTQIWNLLTYFSSAEHSTHGKHPQQTHRSQFSKYFCNKHIAPNSKFFYSKHITVNLAENLDIRLCPKPIFSSASKNASLWETRWRILCSLLLCLPFPFSIAISYWMLMFYIFLKLLCWMGMTDKEQWIICSLWAIGAKI